MQKKEPVFHAGDGLTYPYKSGYVSTLFGNPAVRFRGSVGLRRQVSLALLLSESAATNY